MNTNCRRENVQIETVLVSRRSLYIPRLNTIAFLGIGHVYVGPFVDLLRRLQKQKGRPRKLGRISRLTLNRGRDWNSPWIVNRREEVSRTGCPKNCCTFCRWGRHAMLCHEFCLAWSSLSFFKNNQMAEKFWQDVPVERQSLGGCPKFFLCRLNPRFWNRNKIFLVSIQIRDTGLVNLKKKSKFHYRSRCGRETEPRWILLVKRAVIRLESSGRKKAYNISYCLWQMVFFSTR